MSWIKLSVHRIAVNHLRDIISEVSGRSMLSGLFQSYFLYRRNRAKGGPFYSQNANMVPVLRMGKRFFIRANSRKCVRPKPYSSIIFLFCTISLCSNRKQRQSLGNLEPN